MAPVAQLDRVSGFEPEGCRFESCQARHILVKGLKFKVKSENGDSLNFIHSTISLIRDSKPSLVHHPARHP